MFEVFQSLEDGVAEILAEQPRWWTAVDARASRGKQWFRLGITEEPTAHRSVIQRTRLLEMRAEVGFVNDDNKEEIVAAILGTFDVWHPALLVTDVMILNSEKTDQKVEVAERFANFFNGKPYQVDYIEYENATGEQLWDDGLLVNC